MTGNFKILKKISVFAGEIMKKLVEKWMFLHIWLYFNQNSETFTNKPGLKYKFKWRIMTGNLKILKKINVLSEFEGQIVNKLVEKWKFSHTGLH